MHSLLVASSSALAAHRKLLGARAARPPSRRLALRARSLQLVASSSIHFERPSHRAPRLGAFGITEAAGYVENSFAWATSTCPHARQLFD